MRNFLRNMHPAVLFAVIVFVALASIAGMIGVATATLEDGNRWASPQYWDNTVNANARAIFNASVVKTPAATITATTLAPSLEIPRYHFNSSANAILVTLPSTVTNTVPPGWCQEYLLKTAGNAVSFTPSAVGQLLDNSQAAYSGMDAVGDAATICSDGSNYFFQSRYIH